MKGKADQNPTNEPKPRRPLRAQVNLAALALLLVVIPVVVVVVVDDSTSGVPDCPLVDLVVVVVVPAAVEGVAELARALFLLGVVPFVEVALLVAAEDLRVDRLGRGCSSSSMTSGSGC